MTQRDTRFVEKLNGPTAKESASSGAGYCTI
nr:hypothetical protein [Mucilaginibacter sp. FT3.2]